MDEHSDYSESDALLDKGAEAYGNGDFEKAKRYYEQAAELGNDQALCNLGYIYEYGRIGEKDPEQAFYCYSEAALGGNANALYKVGDAYYYGDFVKKNPRLAFKYYMMAGQNLETDKDDDIRSDIDYRLAKCCAYGIGAKKDLMSALHFINDAEAEIYLDQAYHKPGWQKLKWKIEDLRKEILVELDELLDHSKIRYE